MKGATAGIAAAMLPRPLLAVDASFRPLPQEKILAVARREMERVGAQLGYRDRAAVVDYSRHSTIPRFHIVDLEAGTVAGFLVTHGRGSDPAHLGWVQNYSNQHGSLASSRGAYRTAFPYDGDYGRALRLDGLDPTNDQAMDRAIVLHTAWYAEPDMIRKQGKLGRSEGCFVFPSVVLPIVMDRLGPGRMIFVDNLEETGARPVDLPANTAT